ncbi:unnamed protein product [Effrenium voratum]|nr:unnamed protein product [Effrenium voratum]
MLPWPWVVETAGKQVYFCRRSSSLVTSWEHPMQSIHRRMMGVLQEARPSLQGPKLRMGLRKLMELELDGLVPSGLENLRACQGDDPRMEATSILALALIGCNKILRQLGEEAVDDATLWQQAAGAADRGQPSLQLGRMPMDRLEDASSCAKSTSPGNQSTWSGLARRHDDFINMATEADLAQCRLTGDVRNQGDQGSQRDLGGQEGQRQHREQSDPGVQRSHRDQGDQGSQRDLTEIKEIKEANGIAAVKEIKVSIESNPIPEFKEVTEIKKIKEANGIAAVKEIKVSIESNPIPEFKSVTEIKEIKEANGIAAVKEIKVSIESNPIPEFKEVTEIKEIKEANGIAAVKEIKVSIESNLIPEFKEVIEIKKIKEATQVSQQAEVIEEIKQAQEVR